MNVIYRYYMYSHIHLRLVNLRFYNSQTKHDMEMELTSIDFSRRVAEGFRFRSSWLQTLGNQLIDRSPIH